MRCCRDWVGKSCLGSPCACSHPRSSTVPPRGHSLQTLQLPFTLLIAAGPRDVEEKGFLKEFSRLVHLQLLPSGCCSHRIYSAMFAGLLSCALGSGGGSLGPDQFALLPRQFRCGKQMQHEAMGLEVERPVRSWGWLSILPAAPGQASWRRMYGTGWSRETGL